MSGITSLRLKNFRRYRDATFTFGPGTTFLEGENNAGKTSVFYAIEYALFGRVGTVLAPADLVSPKADGMGVELSFVGRDGRAYRLQRVHLKAGGKSGKLVGHFTLWARDPEPDAPERYLLSSDFDQVETDLQLVVQQALGLTRRGWDLAVHLRQGAIPDILDGGPQLDIVLGVTTAVFLEEELRAMALEREKAATELPALQATLERLGVERGAAAERLAALGAERAELERRQEEASGRAAALEAELDALAPIRDAAEALGSAERRAEDSSSALARAVAVRDAQGDRAELAAAAEAAARAITTGDEARKALREELARVRDEARTLDRGRGDLEGRLERRRQLTGVCDHCGQAVDPAHLAAQIPELEGALVDLDGWIADLAARLAADEARLAAADEAHAEARVASRAASDALKRRDEAGQAVARAEAEVESAAHSLAAARAAARAHAEAPDARLLAALRLRFEAERDRLRAAQVRLQADLEHGAERLARVGEDLEAVGESLRGIDREHARTATRAQALRADAELATRLRALGKGFKQVQQDLREQATAAIAERTLALHRHLSGDDGELKDVVVDPKRYVVQVTPKDLGKRVPAAHAQGGGHRLLLGLAVRLALAEQLGPVPFVLLDEPTYGLDRRRREALLGRIAELDVSGQLLLVTHHDVGTQGKVVRVVRDGAESRVEVG